VVEKVVVDVQLALDEVLSIEIPDNQQIQQWVAAAIEATRNENNQENKQSAQLTVRIVEEAEISQLNEDFRHKSGATNVLSFPFVSPPGIPENNMAHSLGDLVVCAAVVNKEAKEQFKKNSAHWAHIIIHGTLHLVGLDHMNL